MKPVDSIVNFCETVDLSRVVAQLQTDFSRAGIAADWKSCVQPVALKQKLVQLLEDLLQTQPEVVLQLLYLADVSEIQARELIARYPDQEAGVLGYLLLKKAAEKIEWRKRFS